MHMVTLLAIPLTIQPYITREQPISIDSRSLPCMCIALVIPDVCFFLSLLMLPACWSSCLCSACFWPIDGLYSIIVIICHTISFNAIFLFGFFLIAKFPIILLHFISLEFLLMFCSLSFKVEKERKRTSCIPILCVCTLHYMFTYGHLKCSNDYLESGCHYYNDSPLKIRLPFLCRPSLCCV